MDNTLFHVRQISQQSIYNRHAWEKNRKSIKLLYQVRSWRWLWEKRIVTLSMQFFDGDDDKNDLLLLLGLPNHITLLGPHKILGHAGHPIPIDIVYPTHFSN